MMQLMQKMWLKEIRQEIIDQITRVWCIECLIETNNNDVIDEMMKSKSNIYFVSFEVKH
jgi:hypothetical protein